MERLTWTAQQKAEEGIGAVTYVRPDTLAKWEERLSAYEDIGLSPDEISQLLPDGGLRFAIRSRETELQNSRLRAELDAVKRERDGAVRDMQAIGDSGGVVCYACKLHHNGDCEVGGLRSRCKWEWRGVQEGQKI